MPCDGQSPKKTAKKTATYSCHVLYLYKTVHGKNLIPVRFRGFLRLWWAVSRPIFCQKIVGRVAGRALRLFWSGDFGWFLLADFVRKSYRPAAVRASWGRDSGLTALQRRPCCNAMQRGPRCRAGRPLRNLIQALPKWREE